MRMETIGRVQAPLRRVARLVKTVLLVFADTLAAILATIASFELTNETRQFLSLPPIAYEGAGVRLHLCLIGALTSALLIWFWSKGHYKKRQALADQLGSILAGIIIAMLCASAVQFATVEVGSRVLSLSYWVLLVGAILSLRMLARYALRASNAWLSPATLFTCSARSAEIATIIRKRDEIGAQITKIIATDGLSKDHLIDAMCQAAAEEQIVIYTPSQCDPIQSAVTEAMVLKGVPFMLSPQLGSLPDHAEVLSFPPEDLSLIEVRDPLSRPVSKALKRGFDVIFAGLALVALSPVLAPIVLLIRSDGGPALFRQKRVGRNGEIFDCLKLRSMVVNAETKLQHMIDTDPAVAQEWKSYQKLRKDPRITWTGRLIRKTNLDELPQLVNVIKGDMSLVGPRPMTLPQIEEYGVQFEAYKRVRPGITGLWQVNGRNETTFTERARLDAFYVRNWSLWRDVVILVRTVREVIMARGK